MAREREQWALSGEAGGGAGSLESWRLGSARAFRRADRTTRLERRIGRALWALLGLVLLWIGLS